MKMYWGLTIAILMILGAGTARGVDGSGNVYAAGDTDSSGWIAGGLDATYHGNGDGFLVKLTSAGELAWAKYLGGSNLDKAFCVATDGSDNVYVGGFTGSTGWISGGYDTNYGEGQDGFVAKFSGAGARLWSTYVGGSLGDAVRGIVVDHSGNVVVTGGTESTGWISGGYDTVYGGNSDAFVVKLSSVGAHLWSTFLGGTQLDRAAGIAVDALDNIYVVGDTASTGWMSGGYQTTYLGVAGGGGQGPQSGEAMPPQGTHPDRKTLNVNAARDWMIYQ